MILATGGEGLAVFVGFGLLDAWLAADALGLERSRWRRVASVEAASRLVLTPGTVLIGRTEDDSLSRLARAFDLSRIILVPGPYGSAIAGDGTPTLASVLDRRGDYRRPGAVSELDDLLATADPSADELARAVRLRAMITALHLGIEPTAPRLRLDPLETRGRSVVLVAGEADPKGDAGLVAAARAERPDAFIVYRPEAADSRDRDLAPAVLAAARAADHLERRASAVAAVERAEMVVVGASPVGFDALLRDRPVIAFGAPFYAGWGLTIDRAPDHPALRRRRRVLTVEALLATLLLRYALFRDWKSGEAIDPERVLRRLHADRTRLEMRTATMRRLARLVPASVGRFARSVGVALTLLDNRRP